MLDTATQDVQREATARKPRAVSRVHLCKVLERYGILHAVNAVVSGGQEVENLSRWVFLGNLIREMKRQSGRSVKYVCFLHDYFHAVLEEVLPQKGHSPTAFASLRTPYREDEDGGVSEVQGVVERA